MASGQPKNPQSPDLSGLADPSAVEQSGAVSPDNAIQPAGTALEVANIALRTGLSGITVKIVLAASEGKEGKEAQFVRVNEHTWLVPRVTPSIVPVEAYEALANTTPPAQEGAAAFFSPRFSVSVIERYPAPQQ